jgi:DNA-binding transcriptional MocR family regulator
MTSYQNPTGVTYSQDKKLQLLYLAEKYDTYILEDEYLSELNFYKNQEMPVKALDANSRIIYLKSFSKIFMPGIRLGFLITPEEISKRVLSAKHTTDISTSSLMQRAFDLYLRKRKWQGHMEMMREVYKKRYDTMIGEMKELAPFIEFMEPFGGIHIWCRTDMDSLMLYSCAKERGLVIAPGRHFYLDERQSNFFRISYAGVEEPAIKKGIGILTDAYNYLISLK